MRRTRLRRSPVVPAPRPPEGPTAGQDERLRALAAGDGQPVAELLREVAEFRLALETDLTIAAAAAEVDAHQVAAEVVDADVLDLHALEERMLRGLASAAAVRDEADAHAPRSTQSRLRRRPRGSAVRRGMALHTGPVLAAAVAIGLAGGFAIPHLSGGPGERGTADSQFASLSKAVGAQDEAQAVQAAQALHASIGQLIDDAADDPTDARDAARLLLAERVVLLAVPGPNGVALQSQMQALVVRLQATAGPIESLLGTPATPVTPAPVAPLAPVAAGPSAVTVTSPRAATGGASRGPVVVIPGVQQLPLPLPAVSLHVPLSIRTPKPVDLPHASDPVELPTALPLVPTALPTPVQPTPEATATSPAPAPAVTPSAAAPTTAAPSASATAAPSGTTSPSASPSPVLLFPGQSPSAAFQGSPIFGF